MQSWHLLRAPRYLISFVVPIVAVVTLLATACAPAPAPTATPPPAPKPAAPAPTAAPKPAAPAPTAAPKAAAPAPTVAPKPAAVAPTAAPKPAAGLEKATFRLGFPASGLYANFFMPLAKGYWQEQGLDVEILDGSGSAGSLKGVAAGQDTFGLAEAGVMAAGYVSGMPLKTVGMFLSKSPSSVIYRADSGIKTPKDLEGKSVGLTPGGATHKILPLFLKAAGAREDVVKVVPLDARLLSTSLIEKKVDAISTWTITQGTLIAMQGVPVNWFHFADYGFNSLMGGIVVHNDTIKNRPEIIRKFMAGAIKGTAYALEHPEEAAAATVKYRPPLQESIVLAQFKASVPYYYTKNSQGKPLGWQAREDWVETLEVMRKTEEFKSDLPVETYYTNEFLPTR